jgi:hypothetical protein
MRQSSAAERIRQVQLASQAAAQAEELVGSGSRRHYAPRHSHPHSQRTKSITLNFLRSTLHIAHDLSHINISPQPVSTPFQPKCGTVQRRKSVPD